MELALDQQRVDHVADIVDRGVADDLDLAGVGVDLDLADVAAVRIGAFAAREGAGFEQAGLGAARQPRRHERGAGDLDEAYGLIGAGDREAAGLEFDIVLAGFHHVGGDAAALGDDLLRRQDHGGAGRHGGARAEGAGTDGDAVGVAIDEADAIGRQSKPVSHDLAERGGVALAVIVGADRNRDGAGRVETDFGVLDQAGIGGFDG